MSPGLIPPLPLHQAPGGPPGGDEVTMGQEEEMSEQVYTG